MRLDQLLRQLGTCKSAAEAKRTIVGGGVRINGSKVENPDATVRKGEDFVLRVGRGDYKRILIV